MKRFRNWFKSNGYRKAIAKRLLRRKTDVGLAAPSPAKLVPDDIYPAWLYDVPDALAPCVSTTATVAAALGVSSLAVDAQACGLPPEFQPSGESSPTGFPEGMASHSSHDSGASSGGGYGDGGSGGGYGGDGGGGGGGGD